MNASQNGRGLVFLGAKRTVFGAFGGSLRAAHPVELALAASQAALTQSGLQATDLDHSIWGNVLSVTGDSIYLPRHVGLKLGMAQGVAALGVQRLCGSGFQTIVTAAQQMASGDSEAVLVGGVENMSLAPYALRTARFGSKMGNQVVSDTMSEALFDTYAQAPMAITAENLAERYTLSREQCDAFALQSQKRAAAAWESGYFAQEAIGFGKLERDEHCRADASAEGLAKLKPIFKKDGVVTAGNASGIVDGAAALVVATESFAQARKLAPLGRLASHGVCGCDPSVMGIGPVPAIRAALSRAGKTLAEMDLVEVNEAFAPQTLAVQKELGIDPERLNVNGGAIALGHPLAASGTRIVMQLLYELKRRGKRWGVGSACIGGGQGIAVVVEVF